MTQLLDNFTHNLTNYNLNLIRLFKAVNKFEIFFQIIYQYIFQLDNISQTMFYYDMTYLI